MPKPNFAGATIWAGDNLDVMRGMSSACVDLGAAPPLWMRHPVGLIWAICPATAHSIIVSMASRKASVQAVPPISPSG